MRKLRDKIKLLQLLRILLEPESYKVNGNEKELFELARLNKLSYFYLKQLNKVAPLSWVRERLTEIQPRARAFERALIDVGDALGQMGINYAFFKTVKPFFFLPNDIDVLIFGDERSIIEASLAIKDFGFKLLKNEEPYSVTARSPSGYLVELYREPSISYIIYLDSDELRAFLRDIRNGGLSFRTLSDEGEVVCVASHSIFKEQILTLADVLEFAFRTNNRGFDLDAMISLTRRLGVDLGLELAFNVALNILNTANYNLMCQGLINTISALRVRHPLIGAYINKIPLSNGPPIKFSILPLLPCFTRLLTQSRKARVSILRQIICFSEVKSYHMKMWGPIFLSRLQRHTY